MDRQEANLVMAMAEQVHDINEFTSRQKLCLGDYEYSFFQRIFGLGDTVGSEFNKGGRLYSPSKKSYQHMPGDERDIITINGEAMVEVDIGSSFLTIYRVSRGISFDPLADAYAAIGNLPRYVAKTWVVMTLGYDKHHSQWPAAIKRKYRAKYEKYGTPDWGTGNLQKDYPIGKTRKAKLVALPELTDWPSSPVRWGDLQYIESEAVVEAIHTLNTRYGITALPVTTQSACQRPSRS